MSRVNTVTRALPAMALAGLAACTTGSAADETSAAESAYQQAMEEAVAPATSEEIAFAERSDPLTRANFWAAEYQKNNANAETTVRFLSALRMINSHDRIMEIASSALALHPQNYEIYLELGRSFLANDKASEAAQAFVRSADYSPETDATPLAALGVAFDRLEEHEKAQQAYEIALQREPNRVSTLSNYGMSLALTGRLEDAEKALRKANEQPGANVRVRQNLALVLGLQGRYDEMAEVDPSAPRRTIEANRRALQEMMLPMRDYGDLEDLDRVMQKELTARNPEDVMPEIREGQVDSEGMAEPLGQADRNATQATSLAGAASTPVKLKPKLRGPQDG